jgi:hypothetical protein
VLVWLRSCETVAICIWLFVNQPTLLSQFSQYILHPFAIIASQASSSSIVIIIGTR